MLLRGSESGKLWSKEEVLFHRKVSSDRKCLIKLLFVLFFTFRSVSIPVRLWCLNIKQSSMFPRDTRRSQRKQRKSDEILFSLKISYLLVSSRKPPGCSYSGPSAWCLRSNASPQMKVCQPAAICWGCGSKTLTSSCVSEVSLRCNQTVEVTTGGAVTLQCSVMWSSPIAECGNISFTWNRNQSDLCRSNVCTEENATLIRMKMGSVWEEQTVTVGVLSGCGMDSSTIRVKLVEGEAFRGFVTSWAHSHSFYSSHTLHQMRSLSIKAALRQKTWLSWRSYL